MSDVKRAVEIANEQRHVDRVYARLETVRAEAHQVQLDAHELGLARTPGSLVERDAMVYFATKRLATLDAQYEGLVFGRLDLDDGEVRHIGRLGLRDPDRHPLVIDWRAPGAAAFYQATTEDPMQVVRRRVIRCAGQRVLGVEDDLLDVAAASSASVNVVGDGALLASLAQAKGQRMRDIVSTIQREQDLAIRAPATGVTLIEGGPGTGKTAVALHRAAHLLYRDRRRFEGGGVLLLGPSAVFMSYVEAVLPSLGEETTQLRSLGEVVDGISSDRLDPPALAALKGSYQMVRFLRHLVRFAPPDAPTQLRIVYGGQVLKLASGDLTRLRQQLHARVHHPNSGGIEARRSLLAALWGRRPEGVAWSQQQFVDDLADRNEFENFARAWWPVLAPIEVLGWLADAAVVREAGRDWLGSAQCAALARSWANLPDGLTVADIALVDELRVMLGEAPRAAAKRSRDRGRGIDYAGDDIRELSTVAERYFAEPERPPRPDNYDGYAHVLIDEAQDLSPMQWRMVGRRGRQASWTIVGDPAQSAWVTPAEADRARQEALRGKQLRRFHLGTNYRNSAEIFEFAASVVREAFPGADLPIAVRRTGHEPQQLTAATDELLSTAVTTVAQLLSEVDGTVAVITAAERQDQVRQAIGAHGRDSVGFATERVRVVDGMRAKGMEYDAVVVVAPEEIRAESAAGVRVLYVALTRATHRLVTIQGVTR